MSSDEPKQPSPAKEIRPRRKWTTRMAQVTGFARRRIQRFIKEGAPDVDDAVADLDWPHLVEQWWHWLHGSYPHCMRRREHLRLIFEAKRPDHPPPAFAAPRVPASRQEVPAVDSSSAGVLVAQSPTDALAEARLAGQLIKNEAEQLALDTARGRVVDRDQVRMAFRAVYAVGMTTLRNLPGDIAILVPVEQRDAFRQALSSTLVQVSQQFRADLLEHWNRLPAVRETFGGSGG
jgi:hypothetical protein